MCHTPLTIKKTVIVFCLGFGLQAQAYDFYESAQWAGQSLETIQLKKSEAPTPLTALKKGAQGIEFNKLVNLLKERGFLEKEKEFKVFDSRIEQAVKDAQHFHKLDKDGLADKQLYFALTLDKEKALKLSEQLNGSLAKLSAAVASNPTQRYIIVNIPSFSLKALEGHEVVFESKVVVGKPSKQTPLGKMSLTGIKYNPDWSPPPSIMKKNLLPSLEGDGQWIEKHGLIAINRDSGEEISSSEVTVADVLDGSVKFYQPAGATNALGQLKFETDSKDNIYLHDTNERQIFSKAMRAGSSGCVRVQEWSQLAAWAGHQTEEAIDKKISTGKTFWEKVPPIPVYVTYNQMDVIGGNMVFYPDIYNINEKLKGR